MLKIALDAGHGINTAGKRCKKSLDKNETREWWLNDRICVKIEEKLASYEGYEVIRVDDRTGKVDVPLAERVKKANEFGADTYSSIHHNAGIYGGSGGGIVVMVDTTASDKSKEYQKEIYDSLIRHTGLKGNRRSPIVEQSLYVCKHTKMSAVLVECGFMDSKTDVPIILTDEFADKVADAMVEFYVKAGNLTKKKVKTEENSRIYRVQVGAFTVKENAYAMVKKLQADGYDALIV